MPSSTRAWSSPPTTRCAAGGCRTTCRKRDRRVTLAGVERMLRGLGVAIALMAFVGGAQAEPYPTGAVKIISRHPPGSVTDVLARPLAQALNASLGQPVIVENRPGANGILAT